MPNFTTVFFLLHTLESILKCLKECFNSENTCFSLQQETVWKA